MGTVGNARSESGSDIVCLDGSGERPTNADNGFPIGGVVAVDVYNLQVSRSVFKTLNSIATDSDHIPVVMINDELHQP